MCLAIVKPKGKAIPEEYLWEAGIQNPDGFGIAIADGRTVKTIRTMNLDEFVLDIVPKYEGQNALIHFRFATHGSVGLKNCHPFFTKDGDTHYAMIHNGIIPKIDMRKDESDTRALARLLKTVNPGWSKCKDYLGELGKSIGYSKLAFLSHKDEFFIVNEQMGHWNKGVWYSNYGYKQWTSGKLSLTLPKWDYGYYADPDGNVMDVEAFDEPWDDTDYEFYKHLEEYETERNHAKQKAKKDWKNKQKEQIAQTNGKAFSFEI